MRGLLTRVRRATEDDADLLVAWHADPDVSRYWDDETFTREEILERLQRPDVDAYVVEAEGAPIGYLQAWWDEGEPRRGGIDMFLVPSARGRGFGPDAARADRVATRGGLVERHGGSLRVERSRDPRLAPRRLRRGRATRRGRRAFVGVGADGVSVRFGIVLSVALLVGIRHR